MRATIFDSVAVLTARMARNSIDPAAAAPTGVPWALKEEKKGMGWLNRLSPSHSICPRQSPSEGRSGCQKPSCLSNLKEAATKAFQPNPTPSASSQLHGLPLQAREGRGCGCRWISTWVEGSSPVPSAPLVSKSSSKHASSDSSNPPLVLTATTYRVLNL